MSNENKPEYIDYVMSRWDEVIHDAQGNEIREMLTDGRLSFDQVESAINAVKNSDCCGDFYEVHIDTNDNTLTVECSWRVIL